MAVLQKAHAIVESGSPDSAVRTFEHRKHTVLSKALSFGVGSRSDVVVLEMEVGETTVLPAKPKIVVASSDGIDDVVVQSGGSNDVAAARAQPVQSAGERSEPHTSPVVHIDGAVVFRRQTLWEAIANKGARAKVLETM